MPSSATLKLSSPGLTLICMGICEINEDGVLSDDVLIVPVDYPVPHSTKVVHVAVINAHMSFGSCDKATPAPFAGLAYEITDLDDSELTKGSFKFNFKARLQSEKPDAKWCGYFILEMLCFG